MSGALIVFPLSFGPIIWYFTVVWYMTGYCWLFFVDIHSLHPPHILAKIE